MGSRREEKNERSVLNKDAQWAVGVTIKNSQNLQINQWP